MRLPAGGSVEALRLLADPMRAAILDLLSQEQLCTCHLQVELDAKQTLVSHHLRLLRQAGLVLTEDCGRFT
jgi:ArsR family transcriptional regulator, arsenate/arsenite/antimonite-responsive transcriptional repressor